MKDQHRIKIFGPNQQSLCAQCGLSSMCTCARVFRRTLGNASSLVMTSATCSRFVTRRILRSCTQQRALGSVNLLEQNRTHKNRAFPDVFPPSVQRSWCLPSERASGRDRRPTLARPQEWRRLSQAVGHRRHQVSSTLWPAAMVETKDLHFLIVRGDSNDVVHGVWNASQKNLYHSNKHTHLSPSSSADAPMPAFRLLRWYRKTVLSLHDRRYPTGT